MAGRGFSVILETLMILAQLSYTGSRFPTSSSSLSLGWQLMSWRVWNSFDKQDVKGHYNAGNCNSSMQPGSNHSSFVEYTPHSLLLRQQPGFETRYFLEVGTGANKEQTKHQDPIQGVHCHKEKERESLMLLCLRRWCCPDCSAEATSTAGPTVNRKGPWSWHCFPNLLVKAPLSLHSPALTTN